MRTVPRSPKTTPRATTRGTSTIADLIPPAKAVPQKSAAAVRAPSRGVNDQLARLGLAREQDLVLHLPLRYEDHTRIVPLAALQTGVPQQAEGTVVRTDVQYRPRRQLVCLLEDEDAERGSRARLVLRFFHFYPNQQKALAPGKRVRVFGDVRDGHFGLEIVHPQFHVVAPGTPLPDRLTPIYPTTAGLGQETLRKVIARALASDPALVSESLPDWLVAREHLWKFADAVRFLHAPPPRLSRLTQQALDARTHPAWTRLKFDELVAQQLSLKAHRKARAARRAPVLTGTGALTGAIALAGTVQAHPRAGARLARDQPRPEAHDADAAAAPGRRRQRQDDRRGAGRAAGDRIGTAGRLHGADGDPRRAALPQARGLARRPAGGDRVADRQPACEGAQEGARGRRERRRDARDRHARAVRGRGAAAAARPRDRRRAASVRRRAAPGAARQGDGRGAPADDERDADPAHAGDDVLRRSRRVGDRRDAAGPHAGRDPARQQQAARRSDRARAPRVRGRAAGLLGVSR